MFQKPYATVLFVTSLQRRLASVSPHYYSEHARLNNNNNGRRRETDGAMNAYPKEVYTTNKNLASVPTLTTAKRPTDEYRQRGFY